MGNGGKKQGAGPLLGAEKGGIDHQVGKPISW